MLPDMNRHKTWSELVYLDLLNSWSFLQGLITKIVRLESLQVVVDDNSWCPYVISEVLIIVDAVVSHIVRPSFIQSRLHWCAWMYGKINWCDIIWTIRAMNGETWALPVDAVQAIAFSHDFDRLEWIIIWGVELFIVLIRARMNCNELLVVRPIIHFIERVRPER